MAQRNETRKQRKDRKASEANAEELRVAKAKRKAEKVAVVAVDEKPTLAQAVAQSAKGVRHLGDEPVPEEALIVEGVDQVKVDEAVKKAIADKPAKKVVMDRIPGCKVPDCSERAYTTRGLCRRHEELFKFIYFLFTTPVKTTILLPGDEAGGKPMTHFDLLIKGRL